MRDSQPPPHRFPVVVIGVIISFFSASISTRIARALVAYSIASNVTASQSLNSDWLEGRVAPMEKARGMPKAATEHGDPLRNRYIWPFQILTQCPLTHAISFPKSLTSLVSVAFAIAPSLTNFLLTFFSLHV